MIWINNGNKVDLRIKDAQIHTYPTQLVYKDANCILIY
jgi:hypothetical protein